MAAKRNLYRLRNSCEKLAQMDTDNKNVSGSIISLDNCYSLDKSGYESDTKFEKSRFGETRIEKTNKYAEDYRTNQKSLIIRENKVNEKFDELIENLEQVSTQTDDSDNALPESTTSSLVPLERPTTSSFTQDTVPLTSDNVKSPDKSKMYVDEIKKLKIITRNLQDKIGSLEEELSEPMSLEEVQKIKGKISRDLGVNDIDAFIKFVKENEINLETTLSETLDTQLSSVEAGASGGVVSDGAPTGDGGAGAGSGVVTTTAAPTAAATSRREDFTNQNTEEKKEQLVKLKILEKEIGRRLQVFENMGDIKIERYPIIAARVNKTIKNAMGVVGDYNELMNTIIKNIRDRYYNSEDTDYKDLVQKLKIISNNSKSGTKLKNDTYTSSKNLEIFINKNERLKNEIKNLLVPLILFFIVSLGLSVYYFKM